MRHLQRAGGLLLAAGLALGAAAQPERGIAFRKEAGRLQISVAGKQVATYVYQDPELPRPYFAHLKAPGEVPVTRNYPPVAGQDPTDHGTFHPGLWLAFGDLSGADGWRLKAPVRHARFTEEPRAGKESASFAVENRYLEADGKTEVCRETCRYTLRVRPAGYLLLTDSTFRATDREFIFGDQEEMGLGVRVATPITVTRGGKITDSGGRMNEKEVRGQQPAWCDYSVTVDGRQAGITLMPDPRNTHRSWFHVRDYGLMVANPFAGQALGGGAPSRVVVKPGETLQLRFGVLLHAGPAGQGVDLNIAYQDYLRESARR